MAEYKRNKNQHERLIEYHNIGYVLGDPRHRRDGIMGNEIPDCSDQTMSTADLLKDATQRIGAESRRSQITRICSLYQLIIGRLSFFSNIHRYQSVHIHDHEKVSSVSVNPPEEFILGCIFLTLYST